MQQFTKAVFLCVLCAGAFFAPFAGATALDDYLAADDGQYTYSYHSDFSGAGSFGGNYAAYVYNMTSQQWRTALEVDDPIWDHWLTIVVPDTLSSDTALMFITGGNRFQAAPTGIDQRLADIATVTGSVVALIRNVPNQPLVFTDDPNGPGGAHYGQRSEDEIIAYTFDQYLANPSDTTTWPLLLPMVKTVVKAMDTVQAEDTAATFAANGVAQEINQFVVSGYSKRGWTTWLTGAVDPRVTAIAPIVIDVLNIGEQMQHHFNVYGFFAPSIQDYENLGIFEQNETHASQLLRNIVDPYEYRHRYEGMPKFVMNSAGDEFFVPDSARYYYDDLQGEKYLRYLPNTGHGLNDSAYESLGLFVEHVQGDYSMHSMTWNVDASNQITAEVTGSPSSVLLWQATNPSARDFRNSETGLTWTSSVLSDQGGSVYVGSVSTPAAGYTAFFVEANYLSGGFTERVTTETRVTPDDEPFRQEPRYRLGAETAILNEAFYQGESSDGSDAAGRWALFPALSNNGQQIAFYGINVQTFDSGIFLVNLGDPSSWRRLTADLGVLPDNPIYWAPNDSALIVRQWRIPIVSEGLSTLEVFEFNGYGLSEASVTSMPAGNWILSNRQHNILAIPILANGLPDDSRSEVFVTNIDRNIYPVNLDWPAVTGDGKALVWGEQHAQATVFDESDSYLIPDLESILSAPVLPATNISSLAPATVYDPEVTVIREDSQFSGVPVLSQDKRLVFYSSEYNRQWSNANFFGALPFSNWEIMIAEADGESIPFRLRIPGNQTVARPTRGGTRILYSRDAAGGRMESFVTTLEIETPIQGTTIGNPADNDIMTTEQQTAMDSAGTTVTLPAMTTINFPPGVPKQIQIQTPIDPVLEPQLPPEVEAIPVVRQFGPEGTTFDPPIEVTISYTDSEVEGFDENTIQVFLYNDMTGIFDLEVTSITNRDTVNNSITFTVDHFSTFGLGVKGEVTMPALSPYFLAFLAAMVAVLGLALSRRLRPVQ